MSILPVWTFRQTIHETQKPGNPPAAACEYAKAAVRELLAAHDQPRRRAVVTAVETSGASEIELSVTVVDNRVRCTWTSRLNLDEFARELDASVRRLRCWL